MSDDPSQSLLNAADGVARYEAHLELKKRSAAEVIPKLRQMLEDGTARYPHEIMGLLASIEGHQAIEEYAGHTNKDIREVAARLLKQWNDTPVLSPSTPLSAPQPREERTPEEAAESWIRYLGSTIKTDQQHEALARRKLLEIGAPAVPVLVRKLDDPTARKRRFALLQALGEMGTQGSLPEALDALKKACEHTDPGVAKPAQAVLKQLNID